MKACGRQRSFVVAVEAYPNPRIDQRSVDFVVGQLRQPAQGVPRVSFAAFEGFSPETGGEYDAYTVGEDQPMKLRLATDEDRQVDFSSRVLASVRDVPTARRS